MFENYTAELYAPDLVGPPNDRRIESTALSLPAGSVVFSADNHIELGADIWYERFPARLKDKAPHVWKKDNAVHIGFNGQSLLPEVFTEVVKPFGGLGGYTTDGMDARMRDIKADGMDKELVFPNAILALLNYPDLEVREHAFRIYNEYIAGVAARYPESFYPVGLINWWDPTGKGTRETLAELKSLGLKTFLLPLSAGKYANGDRIDYTSSKMTPVWDEIEASGVPVSHHIGEVAAHPAEVNMMAIGFLHSAGSFRDMFGRYIFGGILDRHPGLQVGWFEGGINWVASAMQDAEHVYACYAHLNNVKIKHDPNYYWRNHMCASFILDPLGLEMIDRLGTETLMWSSDYPHNESSFGYSRNAINQVVRTVGPQRAKAICGDNVARFLKV